MLILLAIVGVAVLAILMRSMKSEGVGDPHAPAGDPDNTLVLFSLRHQSRQDAINIYKGLHKTDPETAAKAVDELAKTLQR